MADATRARTRALGAVAWSITATSSTACAVHNCDFSFVDFKDQGGNPTIGHLIDENTWESNTIDDKWLDYPGQRVMSFHLPESLRGREMIEMLTYVSVDEQPNLNGDPEPNWAIASGNLGEFLTRRCFCFPVNGAPVDFPSTCDDFFQVKNDTCGKYYARVVVRFAKAGGTNLCKLLDGTPVAGEPPSADASTDGREAGDASPLDAASDAPQDAGSD
jgi:hypothetical protein